MSRPVVTPGVLTTSPDEDVLLRVEVRGGTFAGSGDVWVLGNSTEAFLAQARTLYERLDGRASLGSISPGELALALEPIDAAAAGCRCRALGFESRGGRVHRQGFKAAEKW